MRALPVDFRQCRSDRCAEGSPTGSIWRTRAGLPVVAFTRVVDCRDPAMREPGPSGGTRRAADCSGVRAGATYLQYWFYYPGSATGEGSIPAVKDGIRWASAKLGTPSYHRDDWESFQVRVGRRGEVLARASSHKRHVHGSAASRLEAGGLRDGGAVARPGGWGRSTGALYVAGGSHAGRVWTSERSERLTPAARLRLVPLEGIVAQVATGFAVTPPWAKQLWLDPEALGTD